ncbi:hypothetical protein H0H92_003554 [Tricholoma furcatifolium]|nr:hypothetical protein H0H92_003554 [Tricholoma furcatifolium]
MPPPFASPNLPQEVLINIFELAFWQHREHGRVSLSILFPRVDETEWTRTESNVEYLTSPHVFPAAVASVSRTWRRAMSMVYFVWSRVIIFTNAPECLTFARSQLEWSKKCRSPIDLVVSKPSSTPAVISSEKEAKILRDIIEIVKPHFRRCKTILFNVTYTTSLPRLAVDFPDNAPDLSRIQLLANDSNGIYDSVDGTSQLNQFPFPNLTWLEIDGWNFVDISIKSKGWLEALAARLVAEKREFSLRYKGCPLSPATLSMHSGSLHLYYHFGNPGAPWS